MDISDSHEQPSQQQQPQAVPEILKQFPNSMQCDVGTPPPSLAMDTSTTTVAAAASSYYKGPMQQQQMLPAPNNTTTDIDIDSLLLQQFSCMGTTDHEDLIQQFQCLMNNEMNKDSAQFFLEMSNWNLQTAIGCYLDFCNFPTPSMKIVLQTRPSEFQQLWRLQNDGTEAWPNGCFLTSPSQINRIDVPPLRPGATCDILAEIPASQPAVMWRVCTPNGWYFGETIWMIPPGTYTTPSELAARMSQLRTHTGDIDATCPQVHVVISINME